MLPATSPQNRHPRRSAMPPALGRRARKLKTERALAWHGDAMKGPAVALACLLIAAAASAAEPQKPPPVTPTSVLAKAPPADWAAIDPNDLLVMDLASGGRVVIQLADAFAPVHVANIRG